MKNMKNLLKLKNNSEFKYLTINLFAQRVHIGRVRQVFACDEEVLDDLEPFQAHLLLGQGFPVFDLIKLNGSFPGVAEPGYKLLGFLFFYVNLRAEFFGGV